jgi:hypothetical protein
MGNNNSIKIDEKTSFEHDGKQFRLSLNESDYILMNCSKRTKKSILKFIKKIQNDASLTKMLQKLKSLDSEKLEPISYSNYDAFNDEKRKEVIDLSLKLLMKLYLDKFRGYKDIVYMELKKFSEVRRGEHYTSPTSIAYEIVIEYLEERYGSPTSENKELIKEIMEQTKPKKPKKKTKKPKKTTISMAKIIGFGAIVVAALSSNFLSNTQNSIQEYQKGQIGLKSTSTMKGNPAILANLHSEPVADVNQVSDFVPSLFDLTYTTEQNSIQNLPAAVTTASEVTTESTASPVTTDFDSLPVNFLKTDKNEVEQVTNKVVVDTNPWSTVSSPDVGNWNRSSVWKSIEETQKELEERNKTQAAVQQQIQTLIEEELKENIIEDGIIEELGNDMQLQVYDETKELTSKLTKQLKEKLQNEYVKFQKKEMEEQNALDPSNLPKYEVESSKRWDNLMKRNEKILNETKKMHENAVMESIERQKQDLTDETTNKFQQEVIRLQSQLPVSSVDDQQVELKSRKNMLNQVSVFDKSLENLSTTSVSSFPSFLSFDQKLSEITGQMTTQLSVYKDVGKEMVVYNENVLLNRKKMVEVVEEHIKDAVKEVRQQYTVSVILDQVETPDNIPTMETTTNVEPPSTISVQDKDDKVKALYDKTLGSTEELNTLVAVKDIMQCNIQEYEPALFMDTVGEPQTQFQWDPLIGNCDQDDVCMSTRQLYWVNGDSLQKHALCTFKKIVSSSNEALVLISDEKSPFETAAPMRFNLTEKHAMEVLDNGWYKFSSKETNAVVLVSPDDVEFYNLQGEQSILTPLHQLEKIDQQKFTSQLSKIDKDKENKELEVLHASFVKIKEKVVYCMKLSGTLLLMKNVNEYGLLGFPLPPPSPFPSSDTGTLSLVGE